MLNYTEYHIMGKVSKVLLKPGCTPSKFECEENRRKRTGSSTERPYMLKKENGDNSNVLKRIQILWSVGKNQKKLVCKVSKIFHIHTQVSLNIYINHYSNFTVININLITFI